MKKENIYKLLCIVSIILVIVFAIVLVIDYINYDNTLNSAPFYTWIIVRSIEFILPSIIIFIASIIIKKKYSK